jgi:hypothetical protein
VAVNRPWHWPEGRARLVRLILLLYPWSQYPAPPGMLVPLEPVISP